MIKIGDVGIGKNYQVLVIKYTQRRNQDYLIAIHNQGCRGNAGEQLYSLNYQGSGGAVDQPGDAGYSCTVLIIRAVVEPLINQVMQGYNCTVFAYGQTG